MVKGKSAEPVEVRVTNLDNRKGVPKGKVTNRQDFIVTIENQKKKVSVWDMEK